MFFEWKDSLLVGHALIDTQHRELVRLVNELHDALLSGTDATAVFAELAARAHEHFATEHDCFLRWRYPGTTHEEEHARLERQLEEFRARSGVSLELLAFVAGWMRRHFEQTDMKFRPFIPPEERSR